jgi:hypothetical protein
MKRIWKYDTFKFDYIMLNKGDVSTKTFLNKRKIYHYDSFIFGSSRSCATRSREWKKYLKKNNQPFSYGSWNEQLIGIYKKILLIDSLKDSINNAIIIIDVDKTFANLGYNPIMDEHYLISGISKFEYYKKDFINFLQSPELIIESIDYYTFHKRRKYMKGFVDPQLGRLDPINCDWSVNADSIIFLDSAEYYKNSKSAFYERPINQIYSDQLINKQMQEQLKAIAQIFKEHKTNYKIIISPLYDQIKINPTDYKLLQSIFNPENIYDFSGINDITNNMYNYNKDAYHYRNRTGDYLLKTLYSN